MSPGQIVTVVAVGFVAFGLLFTGLGVRTLRTDRRRRATWTTVPGRVIASRLDDGQYRCQIGYEYGGLLRSFWNPFTTSTFADPVGRPVEVLVDPANPKAAVVGSGLAARGSLVGTLFVVFGIVFALAGVAVAVVAGLLVSSLPG